MKKMFLMAMMAMLNYVRACLRSANLKRALVCSCLLAALMCGLAACSSSDDENGGQPVDLSKTVGTWVCTSSQDWWDTENGSGSATDAMKGVTLTIGSDGTYKSSSSSFGLSGQWSVSGSSFSAKSSSGRTMSGSVAVGSNSMRLTGSTTDGYTFDYSFERKK